MESDFASTAAASLRRYAPARNSTPDNGQAATESEVEPRLIWGDRFVKIILFINAKSFDSQIFPSCRIVQWSLPWHMGIMECPSNDGCPQ